MAVHCIINPAVLSLWLFRRAILILACIALDSWQVVFLNLGTINRVDGCGLIVCWTSGAICEAIRQAAIVMHMVTKYDRGEGVVVSLFAAFIIRQPQSHRYYSDLLSVVPF